MKSDSIEEKVIKYYSTDIKNWQHIIIFDDIRDHWIETDEYGIWYTTNKKDFEWWNTLADAINYLKTNKIESESRSFNELDDYITSAKEHGFKIDTK